MQDPIDLLTQEMFNSVKGAGQKYKVILHVTWPLQNKEARLAGHISDRSCEQMVMFSAQLHSQQSHLPSLHHTPND